MEVSDSGDVPELLLFLTETSSSFSYADCLDFCKDEHVTLFQTSLFCYFTLANMQLHVVVLGNL